MRLKWFLLEEIQRSHWLMTIFPISGWCDLRKHGVEKMAGYSIIEHERGTERLYFVRERMDASSEFVLQKLLAHPEWGEGINVRLIKLNKKFFEFDESQCNKNFSSLNDAELSAIYATHAELQRESHVIGMVWNTLEFDKPLLSNYLLDYLKARVSETRSGLKAPEAFSVLTTPLEESFAQKEEKSLLEIAARIQSNMRAFELFAQKTPVQIEEELKHVAPKINSLLEKHILNYAWLPFMYEGPASSKRYFIEVLAGIVKQNPSCKQLLEKTQREKSELKKKQQELIEQLSIDAKHCRLFKIARDIVFTKGFRKDCIYHGFYCIEPLLKEAAKRLGLSLKQIRRFTPEDLVKAIRTRSANADLLNERFEYSVYYTDELKGEAKAMAGKEAREFMKKVELEPEQAIEQIKELKGDCACPGHARGVVKMVELVEHMSKMQEGDILVAHSTNPDIVPAMKKASAIITDLGGITCHAAIVSRELRTPCVIGTRIATKVLKDGDLVEVDATHGTVRKLEAPSA